MYVIQEDNILSNNRNHGSIYVLQMLATCERETTVTPIYITEFTMVFIIVNWNQVISWMSGCVVQWNLFQPQYDNHSFLPFLLISIISTTPRLHGTS